MLIENPKIYHACGTDAYRPALTGLGYDGEESYIWATDGHILIGQKITVEENDYKGMCVIPAAALIMYDKAKYYTRITVGEEITEVKSYPPRKKDQPFPRKNMNDPIDEALLATWSTMTAFKNIDLPFPDCFRVLPKPNLEEDKIVFKAGIDMVYLIKIFNALGYRPGYAKGIELGFRQQANDPGKALNLIDVKKMYDLDLITFDVAGIMPINLNK
jgi:DNA polymerase III sliding clamp (beta) subunit (PCNA family)